MSDTIIIVGSARREGNTSKVAAHLGDQLNATVVHLLDYQIGPFRYDQDYPVNDDFFDFIEAKVLPYSNLVFASPVYWYSMSGGMKIFFDRLSDLLKSRKDLGRQLRGKTLAVLSCAEDEIVNASFYSAFQLSAAYLGMHFGPAWHGWLSENSVQLIQQEVTSTS